MKENPYLPLKVMQGRDAESSVSGCSPWTCRGPVATLLCPLSILPVTAAALPVLWDSPESPQILAAIPSAVGHVPGYLARNLRLWAPRLAEQGPSIKPPLCKVPLRWLCKSRWVPRAAWSSSVRAVVPDPILQPKKASWFDRSELLT